MKKLFSTIILAAFAFVAGAQTSLVGRIYYHPNVMAEELNAKSEEVSKKLDETVRDEIAKAEKKKGRALTAEEKAKVQQEAEEACRTAETIVKGMKTSVTATFKTETEMEMQLKMQVDDEALKNAGVSWAKRKALKAAIALIPTTEKMQYSVKGNLIICTDGKDKDTLTISNDGKYLYGTLDEKTKFKLTRTK